MNMVVTRAHTRTLENPSLSIPFLPVWKTQSEESMYRIQHQTDLRLMFEACLGSMNIEHLSYVKAWKNPMNIEFANLYDQSTPFQIYWSINTVQVHV